MRRADKDWARPSNNNKRFCKSLPIPAGQFADCLHFLRQRELFACLDKFLLRVASLGCVPEYIDKTEQISCVIKCRRDRAGDEKRRAIFSDAPTLNFVLASLVSQFQCAVWCARAALIRSIKYPKMLADNFFRGVAHDFLCGAIPTCNVPFFIERKNCIVDNAFD